MSDPEAEPPSLWVVLPLWTNDGFDHYGTPVAAFLDEAEADAHAEALAAAHRAAPVGQDRQYLVEEVTLMGRGAALVSAQ